MVEGARFQYSCMWGCSSVVERALSMREAPGSIPGISKIYFRWLNYILATKILFSSLKTHRGM